jgi:nitroimidazol reductase NimA-like FMN-containing flavoprotein (pyridoxamine 5'-phosphate oxidase superfamily)
MNASEILAASPYVVLGTAGEDGRPWTTPVWFATDDERELVWVSDPGARHSRNIAAEPRISAVVFDSKVLPGSAAAVYMEADAEQLTGDDEIDRALATFNRVGARQDLSAWTRADVTEPARHRMYRATVTARWLLGERDQRVPAPL